MGKLFYLSSHAMNRSIASRQAQWESRTKSPRGQGMVQKFHDDGSRFKSCQYIESTPSLEQIRKYGSDQFKCGLAADKGPYCSHHWSITHTKTPPLTETGE